MFRKIMGVFSKKSDLPVSFECQRDYAENFKNAVRFTSQLGFEDKWREFKGDMKFDYDKNLDKVNFWSGLNSYHDSAGQCLKWCHFLQSYFEWAFGCKVWVTVGQLWKGEQAVYYPSCGDINRWVNEGIQKEDFENRTGFNLHAWLTMENGEIVDVSYLSTLASVFPDEYGKLLGGVTYGRPDDLIPEYRYVPMIIGKPIMEKIERLSFIPLLASNEAELHITPVVMVRNQ
ncbi:hypothetical protein IBZ12_21130 [Serratia ureilytica]|uniref:hypothetical protein n=1 Tax=Serratia ureilytica TaxID=300181 RepID=UPI0039B47E50